MTEQIKIVISKLDKYIREAYETDDEDTFSESLYEIRDELEKMEVNFDAIEPILKLIESNDDIDYGGPGPLSHFMETFYKKGYEEQLLKSIERKPTVYTLYLLHRIINDKDNPNHKKFLSIMKRISLSKEYPEKIIDEAKNSLTYFEND
jgi:hypothetical protein